MRHKSEHNSYDDKYFNYLDVTDCVDNHNSSDKRTIDDRYSIDDERKYDINVAENKNVSTHVYEYSGKDNDNKEIREICSYQGGSSEDNALKSDDTYFDESNNENYADIYHPTKESNYSDIIVDEYRCIVLYTDRNDFRAYFSISDAP